MDPRSQFGREAEKYLTSKTHGDAEELERLVDLAKPNGGTILDVATGAGHVAFAFSPHVDKVIASDITPQMLSIVEREAEKRGLANIETAIVWAEEFPIESGVLEGVTCRVGAHHFRDPEAFITESFRVLKPGGWLLLVDTVGIERDPAADDRFNEFEAIRDPSHVRDYTVSRWTEWLTSAGFTLTSVETRAFKHSFEEWMDRMSVNEADRARLSEILSRSSGALRQYLNPEGGTFQLHQATILASKPPPG